MPNFRNYPNGFVGQENPLGVSGDPDPEVLVAYNDFVNRTSRRWAWEDERRYCELALRVFGCPHWFLTKQLSNPELCKFRRQYVLDTIEFIRTGQRPTSHYVMSSLFDLDAHSVPSKAVVDIPKGTDGFALWLSHPGGLDDLIIAMSVFFGPRGPVVGV